MWNGIDTIKNPNVANLIIPSRFIIYYDNVNDFSGQYWYLVRA